MTYLTKPDTEAFNLAAIKYYIHVDTEQRQISQGNQATTIEKVNVMSVYISDYLESQELYYVEISDSNNMFYAYMSKSELEDCHCVVNPEKLN